VPFRPLFVPCPAVEDERRGRAGLACLALLGQALDVRQWLDDALAALKPWRAVHVRRRVFLERLQTLVITVRVQRHAQDIANRWLDACARTGMSVAEFARALGRLESVGAWADVLTGIGPPRLHPNSVVTP
jgi:hypothetical protein